MCLPAPVITPKCKYYFLAPIWCQSLIKSLRDKATNMVSLPHNDPDQPGYPPSPAQSPHCPPGESQNLQLPPNALRGPHRGLTAAQTDPNADYAAHHFT